MDNAARLPGTAGDDLPGGFAGTGAAALVLREGFLFTSGYARNAIVHQERLDPGVDLIVKPFSFMQLGLKIKSVLEKKA